MGGEATVSVDEFQALEQRVLQAVELIKKEREARHTAESERDAARTEADELRAQLQTESTSASNAQGELEALHREREAVRQRVERMLGQIDELLQPGN